MATLHPSAHGKSKKATPEASGESSKLKTHALAVLKEKNASLSGLLNQADVVIKTSALLEGVILKISLPTFRSEDQLEELLKANSSFIDAHKSHLLDFQEVYASSMYSLVEAIKTGVSPKMLSVLSSEMGIPKEGMAERLGLAASTVRKKTASSELLSTDDSEKVIGMSRLIGQVQAMVNEAGNPEGFDAAAWLANWMDQGLPALGGRKPSEYMDTAVGQALVSQLLDQIRSGAYA